MKRKSPKMQLSFQEDEAQSRKNEKSVEEDEEESDDQESSDEEEEEDDDDENPTDSSNFKISFRENPKENLRSPPKQPAAASKILEKSVDSKPKNSIPTKGSPPKSPPKRLSDDVKGKGSKKRRVLPEKRAAPSDGEDQQKGRRLWDDENEIALLTAYDEHVRRGCDDNEIFDAVMKAVSGSFNIKQVKEKLRKLKIKHKTAKEKAKGRKEIVFKTPREEKLYELSEKIWGEKKDHESPPKNIAERKIDADSHTRVNSNADSDARVIDEICNPNTKTNDEPGSEPKVDEGIPDLKLEKSANIDNHAVDDIKVTNGNGDSDIVRQPVINVSAQVVDNRDSQEKLSEYEMIGDAKSYTTVDDLVKGGLSIAARSGNSELQQELRELVKMKKEWQDMQLEIIIRQTKLALAEIKAQKQ